MWDQILNFQNIIISDCDERKEYKKSRSQGSHYFQIREGSDVSFRERKGRSGRQHREVGRLLGDVNGD
jgi:ABC-type sulfate transport system substrate-binding protein